ncbi:hypothetical protein A6B35_30550 (plasmid) [Mesorhizobium amorphae CCNWGS0123]|nr:hypothetical protein A6B35_30550 [Mesorhizobium amorphae CCNWGS0123]
MTFYKLNQHIEGGRAAGTGPDIVIDLIDGRRRLDAHEALLEGRQCLPMDGALAVRRHNIDCYFRQLSIATAKFASHLSIPV